MKKRLLSIVLVLTCLLCVCPLQVSALTPTSGCGSSPITYNPLYHSGEEHSNSETLTLSHSHKTLDPGQDEYLDWDAAVQEFRDYLKARDLEFTLYLRSNGPVENIGDDDISDQLFAGALAHTGVSTEGDYLERHWDSWGASWNWSIVNGVYYYALTFEFTYQDEAWHQSIMDDAVADLLNTLNVYGANDYEKVRTVYDYICDNVVYDYDRLEDDSYSLKYTAYAALVDGIAVCSGYATLFYRLMLELGVDARVVSGTANGGNHSWNIVKLNGLYYNLDSTWDAGTSYYSWFLLSPDNFPDHYRWEAYDTAQFHASHPMASVNYDPADPEQPTPPDDPELPTPPDGAESGTFGDGLTWTLYEDGELHVSGSGAIPDYSGSSDSFVSPIAERIVRVVIEEGITSIGDFSFSGCYALTELELPSTLVTLGNYSFEYCTALTSAYIPASVTVMGSAPFSGCSALTDLRVDSGNPNYCTDSYGVIYDQEMTRLIQMPGGFEGAYSIPNGVTELGQWSFEDCLCLTAVDIPESVTVIGEGTFSGAALTEVTIPSGVTIVAKYAFLLCPALSSVTLPVGLTTIEDGVFLDCPALTDVYYGGTQEQWNNVFIGADNSGLDFATVHYSEGTEHEHSYTAVVTPPTCTEDGFTTYTCECDDSYVSDTVEALGHDWGEWVITTQPTATADGEKTAACTRCQETKTEVIPATGEPAFTPVSSINKDNQNYTVWSRPVKSALAYENGHYLRVEYVNGTLTAETYDTSGLILSQTQISLELPIYGGVYIGTDYNFVVTGQNNPSESNSVEVFRVTRYTKDWVRSGSASIYGANTTVPFDAGSLRFARSGNLLFVRTCHEMYTSAKDGLNHQANVTFCVNISSMTVTDQLTAVSNLNHGYVSHSFNQFIKVDGSTLVAVDHGDYYPRSVVLTRYNSNVGASMVSGKASAVNVLNIADSTSHYNNTGVSVGGFECSSSHYLVAGNSASQAGGISFLYDQRNIFVTATPKNNFTDAATTVTWITQYSAGDDVEVSTPHMVKLTDGRCLLMWTADDILHCCFITADGRLDGTVFQADGFLSDCPPIQVGNSVVWYVTNYFGPEFYSIDLSDPGTPTVPHVHSYIASGITESTCTEGGDITYTCSDCGHYYIEKYSARGHIWGDWTVTVPATLTSEGEEQRECSFCHTTEKRATQKLSSLADLESEHNYAPNLDKTWTYTFPGAQSLLVTFDPRSRLDSGFDVLWIYDGRDNPIEFYYRGEMAGETVTVPGDTVKIRLITDHSGENWGFKVSTVEPVIAGHTHSYTATVTAPTCTEAGFTTYTCSQCSYTYNSDPTEPTGHDWSEWTQTVAPTEKAPGEEIRECANCGETETRTVDPIVHVHSYTAVVTPPTCTEQGYTTHTCACGDSYIDSFTAATGHSHSPVVTPPTCTGRGYTTYTCSCGDSYVSDYVEATGHRWGAWQTIKPATQTQTGEELHECSVCHKVETRTVPMIPSITFIDVPEGAWFTDAVNWAVTNNITSGTGNGAFSPDMACSRSQVVTFLWRAAGSPQPSGTNPFSDVTEGAWYYDAVLWAVENGITSGTTATTFAPDMPCSRSQVVTFLYRAAGAPEVSGRNPFSDVSKDAWYYNAVLWAVENGITSGTTATTFAPDMTCSRSQVVTFLYRAED